MDILIEFFNLVIEGIAVVISWVLNLFPDSPTQEWVNAKPDGINLGWLTWFIPFPTMLLHLVVLLTAIGIYYIYRLIGRWIKVVRS